MNDPDIFIAVPVYRGADVIGETLRSIRDQTYSNYRVVVSLDGDDTDAMAAIRPFAQDPRVSIIVQPERLGWARHFNRLVDACDCPLFCYWQQDDLAATNYLETLRAASLADREASVVYADVQWFGAKFSRDSLPSIMGSPESRLFQAFEATHYAPLRGLMRSALMPRPAMSGGFDEGSHGEYRLLAAMAWAGSMLRVNDTLYFKRAHATSAHRGWSTWPTSRRRAAWIRMGLDYLELARQRIDGDDAFAGVLAWILDRLAIRRGVRSFTHLPGETPYCIDAFVRDFLTAGGIDLVKFSGRRLRNPWAPGHRMTIHPLIAASLERVAAGRPPVAVEHRVALARKLKRRGSLSLSLDTRGEGGSILVDGWSAPEPWGVWSDGEQATLALPIHESGRWSVCLDAHHYRVSSAEHATVHWNLDGQTETGTALVPADRPGVITLDVDITAVEPVLRLTFPQSTFLPDTGIADPRRVGLGLRRLIIRQAS